MCRSKAANPQTWISYPEIPSPGRLQYLFSTYVRQDGSLWQLRHSLNVASQPFIVASAAKQRNRAEQVPWTQTPAPVTQEATMLSSCVTHWLQSRTLGRASFCSSFATTSRMAAGFHFSYTTTVSIVCAYDECAHPRPFRCRPSSPCICSCVCRITPAYHGSWPPFRRRLDARR